MLTDSPLFHSCFLINTSEEGLPPYSHTSKRGKTHLMTPVVHSLTTCECCSPTLTISSTADTQITRDTSKGIQSHKPKHYHYGKRGGGGRYKDPHQYTHSRKHAQVVHKIGIYVTRETHSENIRDC